MILSMEGNQGMKLSIRGKFALLIILTTGLISAALIIASTLVVRWLIDNTYKENADKASYIAAENVNIDALKTLRDQVLEIYQKSDPKVTSTDWGSEAFEVYQAQYDALYETEEYKEVIRNLRAVQNGSNVNCIYIYYPDFSGEQTNYIYVADADEEEPCPIGCIDSYDWADEQAQILKDNPETGMDARITNTEEYGWLVSNMRPIFDENHELVAYACTDISMDSIRQSQNLFTGVLIGISLLILLIAFPICTIVLNRTIVRPLRELSDTAEQYWSDGKSGVRNDFAELEIKSNDEIGILSDSMKKMENDINSYFVGLEATKQELGAVREESEVMKELAQKDGLTGVRNKNAYNNEISNVEEAYRSGALDSYGIAMVDLNYLKVINDTYGHEKGDIAIRKVCMIVCKVFAHSPVFRIGGDEFAVILKGGDLEKIDELMATFRTSVADYTNDESLEPWERVSAAIGYAVFEKGTDSSSTDVFQRADVKMYEDKVAQKANRR